MCVRACVCVCVCVYPCEYMCITYMQVPIIWSPGNGVKDGCQPADVGARNYT